MQIDFFHKTVLQQSVVYKQLVVGTMSMQGLHQFEVDFSLQQFIMIMQPKSITNFVMESTQLSYITKMGLS